jgi:hypothetical protein
MPGLGVYFFVGKEGMICSNPHELREGLEGWLADVKDAFNRPGFS